MGDFWGWFDTYVNPFSDKYDITAGWKAGQHAGDKINKKVDKTLDSVPVVGAVNRAAEPAGMAFQKAATGAFTDTVSTAANGIRWTYNNAISQPISTAILMGNKTQPDGSKPGWGHPGILFNGDEWAKSWHAAEHISPGQAYMLRGSELDSQGQLHTVLDSALNGDRPSAAGAIESAGPAYLKPDKSLLPAGFDQLSFAEQQRQLKAVGMPISGNALVEQYRQENTAFRYTTGAVDFGINWYLDPMVLGGKVLSRVKTATVTMPRPATGWSHQDINTLVNSSKLTKTRDWMWQNRDNPQLVNNLSLVQKSALGPRFGHILSTLKSPDEVMDFIKVTMGDAEAKARLASTNAAAKAAIEQDTERLSSLDLARSRYVDNPNLQALIDKHMGRLQQGIDANTAMAQRYNQILSHYGELDQINLTRWSTQAAARRARGQLAYEAATARRAPRTVIQGTEAQRAELGHAQQQVAEAKQVLADAKAAAEGAHPAAAERYSGLVSEAQDRLARAQSMEMTAKTALTRSLADPVKTRIYPGSFFGTPMNVVRSFSNFRPNGWIALDDLTEDSVREVRAHVARIPGIAPEVRERLLNEYLKTADSAERRVFLQELDGFGLRQLSKAYGLTEKDAQDLMKAHSARMNREQERLSAYSAASRTDPATGRELRAHAFHDKEGGIVVAPNMVTKLQNTHVGLDLDQYRKVLARNSGELQKIRQAIGKTGDLAEHGAIWLNDLWKFGTLFRLGYIPRVLADDLAGQVARLGAASMMVRAGWGVKNLATNLANATTKGYHAAGEMAAKQGLEYLDNELELLAKERAALGGQVDAEVHNAETAMVAAQNRVARAQARVDSLPANARPSTRMAAQRLLAARQDALDEVMREHTRVTTTLTPKRLRTYDMDIREKWLKSMRDQRAADLAEHQAARKKVIQGSESFGHRGHEIPGAYQGERGDFWKKTISSEQSVGNILTANKQIIHGNLTRSFNHGGTFVQAIQNEDVHAGAWAHAINAQLIQDALGRMAAERFLKYGPAGERQAVDEMAAWLRNDPAGKEYRRRLGVKHDTNAYIAAQVWTEAKDYLHTQDIAAKALEPDGVTAQFLKEAEPVVDRRPDVHIGQLGESLAGSNPYRRAVDRAMNEFYKVAATLPADRMSRHPLYNQLYMGHARTLINQEMRHQVTSKLPQSTVDELTESARRLAARDMKKLVFDISHRSDASAALRFISPFFASTVESWQRWARIIGDKPQVVGYASKFFTAPLANGMVVDQDGNVLDQYGHVTDPVTGERREVNKADRRILVRVPKLLADGPIGQMLGMDKSGTWMINQDSMNMVTQGDPWFNPGTGPLVQIPVNEFVKNKPTQAELARHLGILPFGPQGGASDFLLPRTVSNLMTAYDTSDERYQAVRLQFLQRAAYEHLELGKPMPSLKKIDAQVRHYWLWSTASSFSQPFATQRRDPYEFYRQQYQNLVRKHAGSAQDADTEFIDKYGESFLVFAQSMSDNKTGVAATKKAAQLYAQHQDLIDKNPDLAALIVGPEGNGPFSPEAYSYQLNTPVVTGGAEMQRSKMTADQAMKENQKRKGWDDFTRMMNALNAQAVQRGLNSINDKGAEDLLASKRALVAAYSTPTLPNGQANPMYNAQWAADYFNFNSQKYEQMMPQLRQVAFSDLAKSPQRSDLRMLQTYLTIRDLVTGELAARKAAGGSSTLTANANTDLLDRWNRAVGAMIEQDTRFGDLWSRYLSRDMGVNVEEGVQA